MDDHQSKGSAMRTPTVPDRHDPASRRLRRDYRAGPAYLLGRPSWVWQSALDPHTARDRVVAVDQLFRAEVRDQ